MARVTLTTSDNPYDPFKQYELWSSYDETVCGYNSSSLLARFAPVDPDETKAESERATEWAVDEIIHMDFPIYNPLTGNRSYYVKFEATH